MNDLLFDLEQNDLLVERGDLSIDKADEQNGALLLAKSVVSLSYCDKGIGMEEFFYNCTESQKLKALNNWKKQALDDGAVVANFQTLSNTDIEIEINYGK